MSSELPPTSSPPLNGPWIFAAWLAGLAVCWFGLQDTIAEWSGDEALFEFGWLLFAVPVCWIIGRMVATRSVAPQISSRELTRSDWLAASAVMLIAFGMAAWTGQRFTGLPPAYHDEYSYLFLAESLLHGRWTWPSSAALPELFTQYHILNEGVMASRYYPGTAMWIAPWLAVGHPEWGHWTVGALSCGLLYWIGRELESRRTGFVAAMTLALSPGLSLFGNLLLAHHPCLLALMIFLYGFVRGRRTGHLSDFLISGCGLGWALLCRPATAAGFGLPFGIWCAVQLARSLVASGKCQVNAGGAETASTRHSTPGTWPVLIGYGFPLFAAIALAIAYNIAVTGSWRTSPYQLYTDIYTPRHVYGLNNVTRGEQHLGPQVLEEYDRWAENLTPSLANQNTLNRLVITALWTVGVPMLLMTAVASLPLLWTRQGDWLCIAWAIISMHAIHWPYWYVGIMGWHYVFETAPLWCLLVGHVTSGLVDYGRMHGQPALKYVWYGLFPLAYAGMYVTIPDMWEARWQRGRASIAFPREQHAAFRQWIKTTVDSGPALVLIDMTASNPHLDLVLNRPGFADRIWYGRYRPDQTDLPAVKAAFPDRVIYIVRPESHEILRID